MKTELLKDIKINRKSYENKILEAIEENIYIYERFNISFSIALGAVDADIDLKEFSKVIRKTDRCVVMQEHICCIIFGFVDTSKGIKATSNLLSKFEATFFSKKAYLGVVNIENFEKPRDMVEKVFDILKFSLTEGMDNVPLDDVSF